MAAIFQGRMFWSSSCPNKILFEQRRILHPKEAWERLGIKRSTYYESFVTTGRLRLVPIGKRSRASLKATLRR